MESQYYDLGKDFSTFRRSIDGSFEQIKSKFEEIIGSKLIGKRIRARSSRGFKQYVKDYEFDVTKITLDDYYDNYVVVAHDNTTPKPKEYFLKPGFKIIILGQATGQPSPQKGGKPEQSNIKPNNPNNPATQNNPNVPVKEYAASDSEKKDYYEAYSIDDIELDIKSWITKLLLKPIAPRDFIPHLGWLKKENNNTIAIFDLKIPSNILKQRINSAIVDNILRNKSKDGITYKLKKMEFDNKMEEWHIRILKTTSG